MLQFLKRLFKKSQVIPIDPKLLEIYKTHKMLKILILDVNHYFALEHPFYLQDNTYSSWVGISKSLDGKNVKYLPKMGGAKVSVREVMVGDCLIFATLNFEKSEALYWLGLVRVIKQDGKAVIERIHYFCHRR